MAQGVPRSWREQFEQSLRRLEHGTGSMLQPSIDAYLNEFPIEKESHDWGPAIDDLHRAALRAAVLRQIAFISSDFELALLQCESPPERAMLYALAIVAWDWVDGVLLRFEDNLSGLIATRGAWIEIAPQAQLGPDRVDFLLTMSLQEDRKHRRSAKLIVECDGHDWHERTKDQARRDRARDRRLQALDLAVFRYTGSDVWRDVFAAAREALVELDRRFNWPGSGGSISPEAQ